MAFMYINSPNQNPPGRIEPDIPAYTPSNPTNTTKYPTCGSTNRPQDSSTSHIHYQPPTFSSTADFTAYLPRIPSFSDTTSQADILRRTACIAAFIFHIPINLIWIVAHGFGIFILVWVLLAGLNIFSITYGLLRLEAMIGHRCVFNKILNRTHFDYVIFGVLLVYTTTCIIILLALFHVGIWIWFLWIMWPCLIVADLVCFFSGWIASWRDIGSLALG